MNSLAGHAGEHSACPLPHGLTLFFIHSMKTLPFESVGRLPDAQDNSAIAVKAIAAGTKIQHQGQDLVIAHAIPLAHRFAVRPIPKGEFIYSWGQPFGVALTSIQPGEYLCNTTVLEEFSKRAMASQFPPKPNFKNHIHPVDLDEQLNLGEQIPLHAEQKYFWGFDRGGRGVGTRNYIVILGTSAQTASFVRQVAESFQNLSTHYPNVDGVVPVAHTEGATESTPNNQTLLLRTLAGFIVHPNVGAVLSVDFGTEPVNNETLEKYLRDHQYPLDAVVHRFFRMDSSYDEATTRVAEQIHHWLPQVNQTQRQAQPLSQIKIALQCGGSDAFSGVSGNPLAAWVAKEIIRYGGAANLAETDELIGSEAYVLKNVKDRATAEKFILLTERFKTWANRHGHSAEGNPSGGNIFRGLYNIAIKSIGAARKRHPDVRLDHVIEYSEPMQAAGFHFMDSPGNDPESIAGQVASGANLIYFVTGNGAITNFPFVPTLKVMTTTERFELLNGDIDINAGRYLEGESLESLGKKALELTLRVLSGEKSQGEKAGHAQVNIWRNWFMDGSMELSKLQAEAGFSGHPLPLRHKVAEKPLHIQGWVSEQGLQSEKVGLVLPTSLCSGEIAKILAERLTQQGIGTAQGISRFVALAHSEGCGASGGTSMEMYVRTTLNHLLHPNGALAVSLEHGCEKTHNAFMRQELEKLGGHPEKLGWFSIQLDGGIDKVLQKATAWCEAQAQSLSKSIQTETAKGAAVGILTQGPLPDFLQTILLAFSQRILGAGMSLVVPENSGLLSGKIGDALLAESEAQPTLAYGQRMEQSGFHVMKTASASLEEILTGLGGSGVQVIVAFLKHYPLGHHPMIPVLQVTWKGNRPNPFEQDFDLVLSQASAPEEGPLVVLLQKVLSQEYSPKNHFQNNPIYQISRGMRGVSM